MSLSVLITKYAYDHGTHNCHLLSSSIDSPSAKPPVDEDHK